MNQSKKISLSEKLSALREIFLGLHEKAIDRGKENLCPLRGQCMNVKKQLSMHK